VTGPGAAGPSSRAPHRLAATGLFLAVLGLGLGLTFEPMLTSGFARIPENPGDMRLVQYILEHTYRGMRGDPAHQSLWTPPFFYPTRGVGAYADLLLAVSPSYAVTRMLKLSPDVSLQLWLLTMVALNFAVAYVFLRRVFEMEPVGAAAGAYLFAFASPRIAQLGHPQLQPQFFSIIVLYGLVRLVRIRTDRNARAQAFGWMALVVGSFAAQFYTSIYLAWFLGFGLLLGVLTALAAPPWRAAAFELVRTHAAPLLAASALGVLVLYPGARAYLETARLTGYRSFGEVRQMVPPIQAWMYTGTDSWLFGRVARWPVFQGMAMEHELRLGLGLVTPALAAVGLWRGRLRADVAIALIVGAVLWLLATAYTSHPFLWKAVYDVVPGAKAIRAVSRIVLVLLLPASLGAALAVSELRRGRWRWAVIPLVVLCGAEQVRRIPSYDKQAVHAEVTALAARVAAECQAFLYTPIGSDKTPWMIHLDAMWASLQRGIPTINGYAGQTPPEWNFDPPNLSAPADAARLQKALDHWVAIHGLDAARICWVR
jgi:hypothetical protein